MSRKRHQSPRCPYCGRAAVLRDSAIVYGGRSYGLIWDCRPCDAYVGVHRGTHAALGRLANRELRSWKVRAHAAFDPLWRELGMPRKQAYQYLQQFMGLNSSRAHIGKFDVDQCKEVIITISREIGGGMKRGNAVFSIVRSREEIDADRRIWEHDEAGDCQDDCDICESRREVGKEAMGG